MRKALTVVGVNVLAVSATRRGETYRGLSRAERADERRRRIATSAVHLFGTREYETVTVAEVCARARVSKRYFYEHFADREDLIVAVHEEQSDWLMTSVIGAVPERPASLDDLLQAAMRTLVAELQAHPERARVIYVNRPRSEVRRRDAILRGAVPFRHFLRLAGSQGEDPLRYERAALALVAAVSEVLIDWITRDMADDPDVLADHLTRIGVALLTA
jgi:AcrR family transcriptional regulator